MSQASELMGDVKSLVAELEKELKSFEKQVEDVGGQFTDLLQLGKMKIHGGIMLDQLRSRRGNVEDAELAQMEAEEKAAPAPEDLVSANTKPELQAAAADAGVEVAASATKADIAQAIVEQAPDPAAGLVAVPEPSEPSAS